MKKVLFLTSFIFLLCITTLFGQNPAMSYQAIVRDGNGQLIANQSVTATIKVRIGSTDIFNQTYNVNTNAHGLLTLNFGDPIFMSTNWENASISCEVRQGGNVYMAENFQSVVAVPLSLYATSMNRDTLHSYLDTDGHILDIRHYMQQNRQYIIYNDIIIHQALEDTAAHIRREMAIMDSAIRSALVDTARDIRIALVDSSRDIRIALVDSSADIRSALLDSASDIRAALVDSARDIRIALVDSAADIRSALIDTAVDIRTDMALMEAAIRSALVDTARDIRIALVDSSRDIRIALVDSSADIRSALVDSASDIRSALVDSARDIRIALVDTAADIRSALIDTAVDIRTDMALMEAAIRSALVDTARDIRIALVDSSRDIRIALIDSSADIRSALEDSARDIRIALVDTAADIRTALLDTAAAIRTFVGVREGAVRSALVDTAADIRTATKAYVDALLARIEALEEKDLLNNGFTDPRDNNHYNVVKIGNQIWMVENLKYLPSVVGPGTGSQTTPHYYVYEYNDTNVTDAKATANYNTYGVLYNWPAAMNGAASSTTNPSGVQGVCPDGWHLPSDAEWTELTDYLGGTSDAGGKLKETGTTHWNSPNTGATNETGFTALPGGHRGSDGAFAGIGSNGRWWSATEGVANGAWYRGVHFSGSSVSRYGTNKEFGFSVRCLRD